MRLLQCGTVVVFSFALFSVPSMAAITGLEPVATGLSSPVFATQSPIDDNRMFVAQLGGEIQIVDLSTNTVTGTFLTIPDVDAAGEGGLLGLAFHPDYATPETTGYGKFYTYVTVDNELPEDESPFTSHIREYSVDAENPKLADPESVREVLSFTQPQSNHNGGWIGFSPDDGYLYIASGDGGNGNDVGPGHSELPDAPGNAQDLTNNLLGKMLRIDVNGDDFSEDAERNYAIPTSNPFVDVDGDDEIWSYGLRNPFRSSFDSESGDLWIGDVGQGEREEVDYQPGDSAGGENYGWRLREGDIETPGVGGPDDPSFTSPIYDYERGDGEFQGETVIGGYAYRGPDPDLQGKYFFGDAESNNPNVWVLDRTDPIAVDNVNAELGANFETLGRIGSFAEDNAGNLYIVDLFGGLYRIETDAVPLAGDYNSDGTVNVEDYDLWATNFGATEGEGLAADGNGNNVVDAADYSIWRDNFAAPDGSAVPEPAAVWLLVTAVVGFLMKRRS